MKKSKQKLCIIFLIFFWVLIASNYITYHITGESLIDILFEEEHSMNRYGIVKKAQPDGRTCTIDGYEITLAKHAFCPDDLDKDYFAIKYSAKFSLTNIIPAPEY